MELFTSGLLGFSIGLLANWLFWRTLTWQRPKVVIAPEVAVERDPTTGKEIYRFKLVNRGCHQVIGITFNAWVVCLIDRPGGKITKTVKHLPTHNSATQTLAAAGDGNEPWGLVPYVFLSTQPDQPIGALLEEQGTRVLATLRVTDAVSGSTVVHQMTFTAADLVEGQFQLGNDLQVVPNAATET